MNKEKNTEKLRDALREYVRDLIAQSEHWPSDNRLAFRSAIKASIKNHNIRPIRHYLEKYGIAKPHNGKPGINMYDNVTQAATAMMEAAGDLADNNRTPNTPSKNEAARYNYKITRATLKNLLTTTLAVEDTTKADRYAVCIFYSQEYEEYVATAPELKGLSAFGKTYEEALKEILTAMPEWLAATREAGTYIPEPSGERAFSIL